MVESQESSEFGKGLAKIASALGPGHNEGDSPDGTGSGQKKSLLGITDGMEEMSKGFIAMAGAMSEMAGGFHDMSGGLHDLADSFHQLKVAVQPIAKSINHVAAGLTAVGLTLIYANWGVGSFFLGNFVFLTSLAMFHYLLRVF